MLEPHSSPAAPVSEGQHWPLRSQSGVTHCLGNCASVRGAHRTINRTLIFHMLKVKIGALLKKMDKHAYSENDEIISPFIQLFIEYIIISGTQSD